MNLKPSGNPSARLIVKGSDSVSFGANSYMEIHEKTAPTYEGSYEFTPSAEMQTIEIADKRATQNITINPVPSNYGLITWNGSTLTVS